MSQMTISARLGRTAALGARGRARAVDAAPTSANHGFRLLCALLVALTFTAVLLLNTVRAEGSYVLSTLEVEATALHDEKVTLADELAGKESSEHLAQAATKLKMVPSTSTATLRLSDGSLTGVASKVDGSRTLTVDLPSTGTAPAKDD